MKNNKEDIRANANINKDPNDVGYKNYYNSEEIVTLATKDVLQEFFSADIGEGNVENLTSKMLEESGLTTEEIKIVMQAIKNVSKFEIELERVSKEAKKKLKDTINKEVEKNHAVARNFNDLYVEKQNNHIESNRDEKIR